MTIIKLPKEITHSINELRKKGISDAEIVSHVLFSEEDESVLRKYFSSTPKMNILIKALANGYEKEMSAEENILDYYSHAKKHADSNDWDLFPMGEARVEAIKFVLNELDVRIKGINDDKY